MLTEMIKQQYKNVSLSIVMNFLIRYKHYEKWLKRLNKRKGVIITKPIVFSHINSHGQQTDLIDMQACSYCDYKFICMYQGHPTKFLMPKPLISKCVEVVAFILLDIFIIFEAPCMLQSNNGLEFCNSVINSLQEM